MSYGCFCPLCNSLSTHESLAELAECLYCHGLVKYVSPLTPCTMEGMAQPGSPLSLGARADVGCGDTAAHCLCFFLLTLPHISHCSSTSESLLPLPNPTPPLVPSSPLCFEAALVHANAISRPCSSLLMPLFGSPPPPFLW